ncbi:MAG: RNA-binding cell elongation regulator Jag/EloR [Tissierellaceae bacterium]
MKYVIKQSKTVDDAIKEALLELDAREEDVEVEVIEEASKGLFGIIGAKEAKVKVTLINDPVEVSNNFLNNILVHMGISASTDIRREGDSLYIDIKDVDSSSKGILIGKRGNTLDSLQYLISLAVNRGSSDYIKIIVDVGGYREKREGTLERLAKKMAEKAIRGGRPVKLEPMNPYERRIIHSTLQNYSGVATYSEGEEPYRRVVIQSK